MASLIKSQLSYKKSIDKAYENFKKSPKERLVKIAYLQTKLEALEEQWRIISDNHRKLSEISDAIVESKYFDENVFEGIEEVYIMYKSDLKESLSVLETLHVKVASKENIKSEAHVKLPKISIPIFSGKYSDWATFRDLYVSLIHNNSSLDEVQKFHYLKGLLSGEAEQLLRHVPITEAHYKESWTILNNRFNNKKYLANSLLERFMNQPTIGSESCSAIKNLLDTINDTLNGLKNLGIQVDTWDIIIIYIMSKKLDTESRKQWEAKICDSSNLPSLQCFKEFLESRFRSLEFLDNKKPKINISTRQTKVMHTVSANSNSVSNFCAFCKKDNHKIANCREFSKQDYDTRYNFVQTSGLCFNCLGRNHSVNVCRSSKCRVCRHKHHSLLHPKQPTETRVNDTHNSKPSLEKSETVETVKMLPVEPIASTSTLSAHFMKQAHVTREVLLATAIVKAKGGNGSIYLLRALLDQGSQASFITESSVQMLGLRKIPTKSLISGLGDNKGALISKYKVHLIVQSRHDPTFAIEVQAYVLRSITGLLPVEQTTIDWPQLTSITLADPQFSTPNNINILLGADVYGDVMRNGLIRDPNGGLTAQYTALGWVLSGPTHKHHEENVSNQTQCYHNIITSMHIQVDDNDLLKQFWQIESDTVDTKFLTEEEELCEQFYARTTRRDATGRYIVRLPFRETDPQCKYGNSKEIALKRFRFLEQRFKKNVEFKARYSEVMREYLDLKHMEPVTGNNRDASESVYLPHHGVIREDKATTKVRIVFDASCKGSNGVSLNQTLMVGPKLQQDLRHIVMRWRTHPICLSADIIKMYRQIIVADEDADFQRLIWRADEESETKEYRLVRVTFGTACAPYLAVKSLQQLANDEAVECPEIAEKIKTDYYVDDLLTGCDTVEEGIKIYKEMKKILRKGGFELQKWVTNDKDLANIVMDSNRNQENKVEIKIDEIVRVLGLTWDKESDSFHYSVKTPVLHEINTKRKVISDISRLFDPLGWLAPCIVVFKVMIQKLWLAGLDWDEPLPNDLLKEWISYRSELVHADKIVIPRWIGVKAGDICKEIHGFCDASTAAYAAVVYLRIIDSSGNIHVNLVTAKTKVAPTMQVSIPRLELMGAVLLAKLVVEVANVLGIDKNNVHGWTDSTVVLAWLSSHPSRWTTFIANRTSEILSKLDNNQWAHVQSPDNPADVASRGCTPLELAKNELWLQGPSWLHEVIVQYKRPKSISTELEQRRLNVHVAVDKANDNTIWTRFSSLQKLVRVIAFCRRFLKLKDVRTNKRKFEPYLTSSELNEALELCIKNCQCQDLPADKNKLKPLNVFHDEKGIIRAQGRIHKTELNYDVKHPIILPHVSHLTDLIIDDAHKRTMHGGPLLMLNFLRTKYWIVGAKSLVKKHVHKCVTCVRYAARTKNQLMGQLPSVRVTPIRPFRHCGVDFAGPINIRTSKGRGNKSYKGYISLFVCMVTKAIHLELVSDLTAESFIEAFKRLVARRGHVSDVWSDNGTNFVGASKELRKIVNYEGSSVASDIREWLGNQNVNWHFIPPHAPNFGGLWEAGVKSTKFHLKRVIGESTLTFEEMTTVLSQIEACLNSRPLSILPGDHDDPSPLTPGHFLVGEPLVIVPEPNYEQCNISTLRRWQLTQRMMQNFWRRWSREYLVHCLQRYKWAKAVPEPQIGDVVLVMEDNLPPSRWLLGRVEAKHPGLDNITRVVTLRCKKALIKRPTSKLCILPLTD